MDRIAAARRKYVLEQKAHWDRQAEPYKVTSTCPTIAEQREKMREEGPDC